MIDDRCRQCLKGYHAHCIKSACSCAVCTPEVKAVKVSARLKYQYCSNCDHRVAEAGKPLPEACQKCHLPIEQRSEV